RAEGDPITRHVLERDEELLTAFPYLSVELFSAIKLGLERKLSYQVLVIAPCTPQRGIGLGDDSFAEIQFAEVKEHLLNDRLVYEIDPIGARFLQGRQAREQVHKGRQRCAVRLFYLAQAELCIVREQQAEPAEFLAQRQGLRLELDVVDARDVRPY